MHPLHRTCGHCALSRWPRQTMHPAAAGQNSAAGVFWGRWDEIVTRAIIFARRTNDLSQPQGAILPSEHELSTAALFPLPRRENEDPDEVGKVRVIGSVSSPLTGED